MCETQVHEHIEHEEMTFLFEQLIAVETARDYFFFVIKVGHVYVASFVEIVRKMRPLSC